jgi:hypothetical protein
MSIVPCVLIYPILSCIAGFGLVSPVLTRFVWKKAVGFANTPRALLQNYMALLK